MHPQNFLPFFFIAFFVFAVGSFIFKVIKNGGFKAAIFGAPITRTVGEVSGQNPSRMMKVAVKVHILGGTSADKAVGLEFVARSFASYQMLPVTLSTAEVQQLVTLLQVAAQGR